MKNIKRLIAGAIAGTSIISLKPAQAQVTFNPTGQWMCQQASQQQELSMSSRFQLLVYPNSQYLANGMGEVKTPDGQYIPFQSQAKGSWNVSGSNVTFTGQSVATLNGETVQSSFTHQYAGTNQNTMAMSSNNGQEIVNTYCQRS